MYTILFILWVISAIGIYYDNEAREDIRTQAIRLLYSISFMPLTLLGFILILVIAESILYGIVWILVNLP